ncbi:MAG: hypothetical protein PHH57_07500 [Candidatus Omnitrophica bacterium]|jgi:hypothetical protein|nr:hypothetical protein [Candidatus Omnitrophota bacterium]
MAVEAGKSYTSEELRAEGINPDITGGPVQTVNGVNYRLFNDMGKRRVEILSDSEAARVQVEEAENALTREITSIINDLDAKLSDVRLGLTDAERDQFLQKAIEQVQPYYDKKKAEIEKGIQTGKIRSAEDVLATIRDVGQETENLLAKYDIDKAETEEDLVNTLADITATKEESLETKKAEWAERIRQTKMGQVQTGVLTSGIGQQQVGELLRREQAERAAIERRAATAETTAQTAAKYDLERVALARKAAEEERIRKIGTPEQEAATTQEALRTAGLGSLGQLPSLAELARRRGEEPITTYRPEALTELAEEQKRAVESRRMELEAEEKAIRAQEYETLKKKTLSDLAKTHGQTAMSFASRYY